MQVTLDIPDDLARTLRRGSGALDKQVRMDLAIHYYEHGDLSVGRAAEFSGVSRADFERELAARKIVRPFSEKDLRHELETEV